MPRGNGTGPAGMGPMTGRGAGYCAGYGVAGFENPVNGRGMGMGMGGRGQGGGGRGRRNQFFATGLPGWQRGAQGVSVIDSEQELAMLKSQADHLQETIEGLRQRMDELQDKDAE